MPLKGLAFFSVFVYCSVGALFAPHLGVYGYLAHALISPERQWWSASFDSLGIRYAFVLAIMTGIGVIRGWNKLEYGTKFITKQELLLIGFIAVVVSSSFFAPDVAYVSAKERYVLFDTPPVKMAKIVVFVLFLTHVITNKKRIDEFLWLFVWIALYLGIEAWSVPRSAFRSGRLEGIGGVGLAEANYFASFMAAMLPLIGTQLIRSGAIGKIICLFAGAFCANAIVLCRSRGAFLGVVAGIVAALLLAPRGLKKKMALLLIVGLMGGVYVVDRQFVARIMTISSTENERDESAQSRLKLWGAGINMAIDHPLGIGVGNWYASIGNYIPNYAGKDAHSTFVKCLAELGWHGFALFGLFVVGGITTSNKIRSSCYECSGDDRIVAYGVMVSIVVWLTCCATITLLYQEFTWTLLSVPLCLARSIENSASAISR